MACAAVSSAAWGLDSSVFAVNGDLSQNLFGGGANIVVGIVDSGVDETHPGLAGVDLLGRPRMVAEANFVTSEPTNTGDDVFGHGTQIAGIIHGTDTTFPGLAPDARFVNARVLDNNNGFAGSSQVTKGIGFALENGAHILNLSLNTFSPLNTGTSQLDLVTDWAAFELGVSTAACAGNILNSNTPEVRSPGSSYNSVSVARSTSNFTAVHPNASVGPTGDGRIKPDIVAPGTSITTYNDDWETQSDYSTVSGCSFATPHIAGFMAQQIGYGLEENLNTDPTVIKATLLNSADFILDKNGNPWEANASSGDSFTSPLDNHQGAGQVNGLTLFNQYAAGEQDAGAVGFTGWDHDAIGESETRDYALGFLGAGSTLRTTLTWLRHVRRTDDGDGVIDSGDFFSVIRDLSNLDLSVLRDGELVAESISLIDNVEFLSFTDLEAGDYTIRVSGLDIDGLGNTEDYALAWNATPIPEPTTGLAVLGLGLSLLRRRARPS